MKKQSSARVTHAHNARLNRMVAASYLRYAAFVFTSALVVFAVFKLTIPTLVLAAIAIFLLVASSRAKRNARLLDAMAERGADRAPSDDGARASTPLREVIAEDHTYFERVESFLGRQVAFRFSELEPAQHAQADKRVAELLDRQDEVRSNLEEFLEASAAKAGWEQVRRLEIDSLEFDAANQFANADVQFTNESGGEIWSCRLKGFDFADMSELY
jgi:hypothetical protein